MTTQLMTDEEFAEAVEEHGAAFEAFADNVGREYATVEDFEEAFSGEWDSEAAYAQDLAESCGMLDGKDETLVRYFDWDMWTRELFMSDYYSILSGNGYFVFHNL